MQFGAVYSCKMITKQIIATPRCIAVYFQVVGVLYVIALP
jgi:hypothetical protein